MGEIHFLDTQRRNKELSELGIHFIGTGVSGGEEGALKGPSIMPGGQKEAYDLVAPIFKDYFCQSRMAILVRPILVQMVQVIM